MLHTKIFKFHLFRNNTRILENSAADQDAPSSGASPIRDPDAAHVVSPLGPLENVERIVALDKMRSRAAAQLAQEDGKQRLASTDRASGLSTLAASDILFRSHLHDAGLAEAQSRPQAEARIMANSIGMAKSPSRRSQSRTPPPPPRLVLLHSVDNSRTRSSPSDSKSLVTSDYCTSTRSRAETPSTATPTSVSLNFPQWTTSHVAVSSPLEMDQGRLPNKITVAAPEGVRCKSRINAMENLLSWGVISSNSRRKTLGHNECVIARLDREFNYNPYYLDFGPLNLGQVHRSCLLLLGMMDDQQRSNKDSSEEFKRMDVQIELNGSPANKRAVLARAKKHVLVLCKDDSASKSNTAFLVACFLVIVAGFTVEDAWRPFAHLRFLPYRDATYGICRYQLKIKECLHGLKKAIDIGWYSFDTFDAAKYEYYEQIEVGDINWIIPDRILAFSGPVQRSLGLKYGLPPEHYVPLFEKLNVKKVIRLNQKQYDKKIFVTAGIDHLDLYFLDGSCPTLEIVNKFLDALLSTDGAVAIHCKAGLGRTGTLIGCYAIKYFRFTAAEWIGWNRICRPGSVLGPQQFFLHTYAASIGERVPTLTNRLRLNGFPDPSSEAHEDQGQGERLMVAKLTASPNSASTCDRTPGFALS